MSKKIVNSSSNLNEIAQGDTPPFNENNQMVVNWNGREVVPLDPEMVQPQSQEAVAVIHRSHNDISLGRRGLPDDAAIMREISANLDNPGTIVLDGCQRAAEMVQPQSQEAVAVVHRSNNDISLGGTELPDDAAIRRGISAILSPSATIVLDGCRSGTR